MNNDSLGNRMKDYEGRSQTYLPRRTYTMLRLDGKSFHTYTKDCERPYDINLMSDMDETAKYLCENIQGCKLAYVQSDEITLVLTDFENIETQAWFDGNVQKITSISASMATAKFNQLRLLRINDKEYENKSKDEWYDCIATMQIENSKLAMFDSRCWVIPDPIEVHNTTVWRQQDAIRNSIQMTGQAHFSHKELQGKSCDQIQEMLWTQKKINWNNLPIGFQRGRCVVKQTYQEPLIHTLVTKQTYQEPALSLEYLKSDTTVTRTKWKITTPPVFTQEPDWIWNHVPKTI